MASVERVGSPKLGERNGNTTLEQRFAFRGVSPERLCKALWVKPLVGSGSLFGEKASDAQDTPKGRLARNFRPMAGFCFDVRIRRAGESQFFVNFSQPSRDTPYLDGDAHWSIYENPTGDGATLVEQINTRGALEKRAAPLTGPKPSLRRWMFFKFGHASVMDDLMKRLAALC